MGSDIYVELWKDEKGKTLVCNSTLNLTLEKIGSTLPEHFRKGLAQGDVHQPGNKENKLNEFL